MDSIRIRGARTHNLKDVSLELPRQRLVVITGLSGSGKSSLAFDTLYAEGQRRYVESLSAYARQFLQLMEKPDVDLIEGLSPAIAIEQKAASHNPRSTVGTVTEIHDYLRLLYARAGTPYCPEHGLALQAQTVAQMVDHVLALPEDTRIMLLAPVVAGRKGEQADLLEELRAQGFTRVRVDGKVHDLDAAPRLARNLKHSVDVVIDRLRARADAKQRLAESFETALRHADGKALVFEIDGEEGASFLGQLLLPGVRLRAARARAAPVLLQQPDGRLPALRRPRHDRVLRPEARRGAPEPVAGERRGARLGPAQPLLLLDAAVARRALRLRYRAAVGAAARRGAEAGAVRLGQGENRLPLPGRARAQHGKGARLRRRGAEPRAPLPRDRLGGGARGAGQAPEHAHLPGVRRRPAAARGAPRQGCGADAVRDLGLAVAQNARILPRPAACKAPRARSPSASCARSPTASSSWSTSASTTWRSGARPRRCPAARRSASGSPARSARASPG